MISDRQLDALYSVKVEAMDLKDLVEINSVPVNKALPKELRIVQFIDEIKNPYCFKVGNHVVKTQFSSSGLTLQNALVKSAVR